MLYEEHVASDVGGALWRTLATTATTTLKESGRDGTKVVERFDGTN